METCLTFLEELEKKFENNELVSLLRELDRNSSSYKSNTEIQQLRDSVIEWERKNFLLEAEIERMEILQEKNNKIFNKNSKEKLKILKNIVELETLNNELEFKNNSLNTQILNFNKESNEPTVDILFYEIVKGFNVDFNDEYARIRNKEKNEIYTVNLEGDYSEKIWEFL